MAALIGLSVHLCRILDDPQPMLPREGHSGIQIYRQTVNMHEHDSPSASGNLRGDLLHIHIPRERI